MPFVVPPFTGDLGVTRSTANGARTGLHADVGFAPLQLSPRFLHRPWDATLAGSFDHASHAVWGLAVAGGPILHPWGDDPELDTTNRLLPQLVGRVTTEGTAAGVRLAVEHVGFTRGPEPGNGEVATQYGEAAIGLYVETVYQHPDAMAPNSWTVTAGVTLRSPVLAGVSCCIR